MSICDRCIVCLPHEIVPLANDRQETDEFTRGKGRGVGNNLSVLCIYMDFMYTHANRGFLLAGPAKSLLDYQLSVYAVFISPIHQIRLDNIESVVLPFHVQMSRDDSVVPEKSQCACNVAALAPWVELSTWDSSRHGRHNDRPVAVTVRSTSLKMYAITIGPEGEEEEERQKEG